MTHTGTAATTAAVLLINEVLMQTSRIFLTIVFIAASGTVSAQDLYGEILKPYDQSLGSVDAPNLTLVHRARGQAQAKSKDAVEIDPSVGTTNSLVIEDGGRFRGDVFILNNRLIARPQARGR